MSRRGFEECPAVEGKIVAVEGEEGRVGRGEKEKLPG